MKNISNLGDNNNKENTHRVIHDCLMLSNKKQDFLLDTTFKNNRLNFCCSVMYLIRKEGQGRKERKKKIGREDYNITYLLKRVYSNF